MRIFYSPTADALLIKLDGGAEVARGVQLGRGIAADFDESGRLLAVEILNASAHYPLAELEQLPPPVAWLTLAVAAAESGLAEDGLRKELDSGRLPGSREAGEWVVARHELWNLLEVLESQRVLDDRSIEHPPESYRSPT